MRSTLGLMIALAAAACATAPRRFDHRPARHAPPSARIGGGGRANLFISPVGEPFRSGPGISNPARAWFDGADTNHDGQLTLAEFNADALRFFAVLDRGGDGEIDPDDIAFYEDTLVPEIRSGGSEGGMHRGAGGGHAGQGRRGGRGGGGMGGGGMGGGGRGRGGAGHGGGNSPEGGTAAGGEPSAKQGAARFGWFDYPEPITAMDRNFNRGVDRDEMARAAADRFHVLDRNGDGVLQWSELPHVVAHAAAPAGDRRGPRPARRDEEAEPDTEQGNGQPSPAFGRERTREPDSVNAASNAPGILQ